MEINRKPSPMVAERNRQVIAEFDRLVAEERESHPERWKYISKQYYAQMIADNPVFGLSENYIIKIINNRHVL